MKRRRRRMKEEIGRQQSLRTDEGVSKKQTERREAELDGDGKDRVELGPERAWEMSGKGKVVEIDGEERKGGRRIVRKPVAVGVVEAPA
jgi:hypothetical protein